MRARPVLTGAHGVTDMPIQPVETVRIAGNRASHLLPERLPFSPLIPETFFVRGKHLVIASRGETVRPAVEWTGTVVLPRLMGNFRTENNFMWSERTCLMRIYLLYKL